MRFDRGLSYRPDRQVAVGSLLRSLAMRIGACLVQRRVLAAPAVQGVRSLAMATIRIDRPHHMAQAQAKALAERLALDFERRFELAWHWDGDDIHFQRPGVSGQMHVGESNILVEVRLGMLLAPLKPAIERQMHARLDALDGGPTSA